MTDAATRRKWRNRQASTRERLQAEGLVRVELWIPKGAVDEVKELVDRRRAAHSRKQKPAAHN